MPSLTEVNWNRSSIDIPKLVRINNKMVEQALYKFSKYCRFTNSDPSKKFKLRSALDDDKECPISHE